MDGKKLKNIRFPVLVAVLAAMLLACAGYLIVHGSTYTAELKKIKNDYLRMSTLSVRGIPRWLSSCIPERGQRRMIISRFLFRAMSISWVSWFNRTT